MKFGAVVLSSLLGYALASPAIVWKSGKDASERAVHYSEAVDAAAVLSDVIHDSGDGPSLDAVVFLLDRSENGSERLSELASSGSLTRVASKYDAAHCVHHHVAGIESPFAMVNLARSHKANSVEMSLTDFSRMTSREDKVAAEVELTSLGTSEEASDRAKALARASVLVVNIPSSTSAARIDEVVGDAIENETAKNIMLAGVRSIDEVKHERAMASRRRMSLQKSAGDSILLGNRRRLEDADDANGDNGGDDETEGVYYVHMTPNIFAGILFTLFFAFVAATGINCMGMIAGQDVYVNKMPTIGREA